MLELSMPHSLKGVRQEIAAAEALAAEIGLGPVSPRIIKLAKHTTLKLDPLPIVARIQTNATPALPYGNAEKEVRTAAYLAVRSAPTVRPTSLVHAGPYVEDGYVINLWDFVRGRPVADRAEARQAATALKEVHQALEDAELELPAFTEWIETCEPILCDPLAAPGLNENDRLFLHRLHDSLREELKRRTLTCRALHGDAHLGNVLVTREGAIWVDLEAACTGPLEWDVATLPRRYWSEFAGLDLNLAEFLSNFRSVCVATWCWAGFDRSSETAEAAIYHLQKLKKRFE